MSKGGGCAPPARRPGQGWPQRERLDLNAIDPTRRREVKGYGIWDPQLHLPFPYPINPPPPLRPQERWRNRRQDRKTWAPSRAWLSQVSTPQQASKAPGDQSGPSSWAPHSTNTPKSPPLSLCLAGVLPPPPNLFHPSQLHIHHLVHAALFTMTRQGKQSNSTAENWLNRQLHTRAGTLRCH